tara:strand:- start:3495 stop:4526 length:1032 start_codon:yes stop_codon:yes gene_type:complete
MDNKLYRWVKSTLSDKTAHCEPLAGDASARQYFRVQCGLNHYIAMVSPPKQIPLLPFVEIARAWAGHGIKVPELISMDLGQGFALMTDFGNVALQDKLSGHNVDYFYHKALEALVKIQIAPQPSDYAYPMFDTDHIFTELGYFSEWCVDKLLGLKDKTDQLMLKDLYLQLVKSCQEQPQVVVHRDYHCRNIMVLPNANGDNIGIIDFQDAVIGPITYDWVSLTKDCYVQWPREKIESWLKDFYDACQQQKSFNLPSFDVFQLWFDMTGLQRHLKVLGIFSRLSLRDGKSAYLQDAPRIMDYIFQVCDRYTTLQDFQKWLEVKFWPALKEAIEPSSHVNISGVG